MKKISFVIFGMLAMVMVIGCGKKENPVPVDQPIVSEQTSVTPTMLNAQVVTEPIVSTTTPVADSAVATTSSAMSNMTDTLSAVVEHLTNQQIQQALKNAGLYQGKVDGDLGPKTKRAIEEFQSQNGLKVDGKVGPKTWSKLGAHLASGGVALEPVLPSDTSATATTTVTSTGN